MALFYRDFWVESVPAACNITVSADTRYQLFVNGHSVKYGPVRGSNYATYCDRVNIAPFMRQGANRLAIRVVHFTGDPLRAQEHYDGPVSMVTTTHGGLLVLEDATDFGLSTDEAWMCYRVANYAIGKPGSAGYANSFEIVDGHAIPTGWKLADTQLEEFAPAVVLCTAHNDADPYGVQNIWQLAENPLPNFEEKEYRFHSYIRCDETYRSQWNAFLQGYSILIAPHTKAFIELDARDYVLGYPTLKMRDGENSTVSLVYAEAYGEVDHQGRVKKQIRDAYSDTQNLVYTEKDVYRCTSGRQSYSPLCWRALRFLRLEIVTQEAPLYIDGMSVVCVNYPLAVEATVKGDAKMEEIWNMSLRTMRSCLYETFMDSPFFEQMQYVMDTMLQVQYTYPISRDTKLIKKAMQDFYESQLPNGLLPCYAPSKYLQIIPCYGLYWLLMVHSYYERFGDLAYVRRYFPGIEKLLGYFQSQCGDDGLYHHTKGWDFVDWADSWPLGCPVSDATQVNLLDNYLLLYAYKAAGELMLAAGRRDMAAEYAEQYDRLKEAVLRVGYDEKDGLFRSATDMEQKSQHAQVLAVLAGIVEADEAKQLMKRMVADETIVETSLSMRYFVLRALEMTGTYSAAKALMEPWERAADYHLLTIPETINYVNSRSDCHAWSAMPLYEYTACYLGVQSIDYGRGIRIKPLAEWVPFCSGKVVTPQGVVTISVRHSDKGCRVEAQAPQVPVYVELPSGKCCTFPAGGSISVSDETD